MSMTPSQLFNYAVNMTIDRYAYDTYYMSLICVAKHTRNPTVKSALDNLELAVAMAEEDALQDAKRFYEALQMEQTLRKRSRRPWRTRVHEWLMRRGLA